MTDALSSDVPDDMAERVALVAHAAHCPVYNGHGTEPAPRFAGRHRDLDMIWARIHIADVCNGLGITPAQLDGVAAEPNDTSDDDERGTAPQVPAEVLWEGETRDYGETEASALPIIAYPPGTYVRVVAADEADR